MDEDILDKAWNKLVCAADIFFCSKEFKEEGRALHDIIDRIDEKFKIKEKSDE